MKHRQGGGEVSEQAEARPTAYIDHKSHVQDRAWVQSGQIIASTVAIECRVTDNARIVESVVSCDQISGATVYRSGLFDQVRAFDQAKLAYVEAVDGARIYGNAVLIGRPDAPIRLSGDIRMLTGVWHRAPRYVHLGFCFITESAPGWVLIDCKHAPYQRWFRVGDRFARRYYGWTPEMLAQVRAVLTEWSEYEDLRGKHWGRCVEGCASLALGAV